MSCHQEELGISPKTVETYDEHIKIKLGYADAEALHRGARERLDNEPAARVFLPLRARARENRYSC
jgi:hypothetical protein